MTFFAKQAARRRVAGQAADASAASGMFIGKVGQLPRRVAAHQPADGALRRRRTTTTRPAAVEALRRLLPDLPAHQGRRLVGPPARGHVRAAPSSTRCPTLLPDAAPRAVRPARRAHRAATGSTRPTTTAQVGAAPQRRFRFEEALVTQLVLARRRRASPRELGAPGAHRRRRRAAGGVRRAAAVRAHRRASARSATQIEDDLAQPHPMNRLLQGEVGSGKTAGRAARDAARRRLRRPGGAAGAHRGARPAAPPLDHRAARRPRRGRHARRRRRGHQRRAAHRVDDQGASARSRCSRIASGEAGIVIGTHALLEEQVTFADLGLVVVDEQHRFGVEQRAALTDKAGQPAARAGDDRDADPAHGRDDRLRRPRDLAR